ncbi:MAG: hypothetical protein Q9195_002786 [Heterodermia aff. obscurata]
MLEILRSSEKVFVPLTIDGGIRDTLDTDGTKVSALQVAELYFDSGADKLALAVEALGSGEILLNCIDKGGSNSGFDLKLIDDVKKTVKIPVITSSGAGVPSHFE